jgi:hypothetical protein
MPAHRKHVVKLRFSDDELKRVRACFVKRKVASSIRSLALGQPPPRHNPMLEVRRELVRDVARIGNNLNQLARGVNQANLSGSQIDTLRLLAKLIEIQEAVQNL